ncbi:preprotein translocase subunit SecE [Candidatus Saccharibacteria bacterium]|jgi:preprotein translocase SecE subunit|nr:preprotein translocase subunit SecE [Candidatus Saccharibacteria bacterium]MBP9132269.1 preprotein translocase subunit SecE [Candidatus Saccharibacteria bacterium]
MGKVTTYLKGSVAEIRKVTWPTRREAAKLTFAVIVFSLAFSLLTSLTDFGINQLFERVIIGS